jgi:hypothetical protein
MTNQNAKVSNFPSLQGVFLFVSLRGAEGDEAISGIATPRQVGARNDKRKLRFVLWILGFV